MPNKRKLQHDNVKTAIKRLRTGEFEAQGNLYIKLKITGPPDDWLRLKEEIDRNPGKFGLDFYSCFVYPAIEKIQKKQLGGRHKYTHHVVQDIKREGGYLSPFFSYWSRQDHKIWPDYLRKLINNAIQDEYGTVFRDRFRPTELTAYCLSKRYGPLLQSMRNKISGEELINYLHKQKLTPGNFSELFKIMEGKNFQQFMGERKMIDPFGDSPGNFDNFRRIYIQDDNRPERFRENFIKGKTPQEVEKLAYIPPLRSIFSFLKLI